MSARIRDRWRISSLPRSGSLVDASALEESLRIVRYAGRRARAGLAGRSHDRPLKLIGLGFEPDAHVFFASPQRFLDDVRTVRRRERHRYLVAHNFMSDEFAGFDGPKVWYPSEPPHYLPERTRERVKSSRFREHAMSFDDPDPARRRYYAVFPEDRGWLGRRRRSTLAAPRPGRCCIVNRYASGRGLLDERIRFVGALGDVIDIYGREPRRETEDGWLAYPTARGPVRNKLATFERYTFALVFENSDHPGYVTEKLPHALMAGAVPLYWGGGGLVADVVPPECYLDCRDRDPAEVAELVRAMPFERIVEYRRAGLEYLVSPLADRLTRAHWARQIVRRLEEQEI